MSSEPKNGPRLVVIEGKEKGKVIPLSAGTVVIGRSKGDVVIPDARISRSHVTLTFDPATGRLTFEDLKSLNGTQLNGETATSGELKDGDRLQVGNTVLDCQLGGFVIQHAQTKSIHPAGDEPKPRKKAPEAKSFADALREEPQLPLEPVLTSGESGHDSEEGADSEAGPKRKLSLLSGLKTPKLSLPRPSKKSRNLAVALALLLVIYVLVARVPDSTPKGPEKVASIGSEPAETSTPEADIESLEAKVKESPNDADTLLELGRLYGKQGRYDEALAVYRRARTIPNVSPIVHVRLINTFLRTNLTQEVEGELNALDQAIKEGRHSKALFVEAASLYLEFREIKQSPEKTLILSKALQNDYAPGDPVGYKLEIQALLQQERSDEALKVIAKGLAIAPNDEWFLENQAYIYLSQKQIDKAMASVDNWLTFYPQSSKPLLVMGYLKFNQKDYDGVILYLQRVVDSAKEGSKDPYLAESMSLLAQVFEVQGKNEDSLRYYKASCDTGFDAACTKLASLTGGADAKAQTTPATAAQTAAPAGQPSPASVAKPDSAKKATWPARAPNTRKKK